MTILSDEELNRYSIALRDFEKAKEYICAAKKQLPSSLEYEALLFAAIVSYYRPFSPNEKSQSAKATSQLHIKDFGFLNNSQSILHQKYRELRNKALAHSEFELNPTKFNSDRKVFSSQPFSLLNEALDLEVFDSTLTQFIELCHEVRANYSRHEI